MTAPAALLSVEDLRIAFTNDEQRVVAVNGVSFTVSPGQVVGIAGESGSGKSTVAHAILRLLPASAQYESGRILFQDRDLATLSPADLRGVRGGGIGMIFQEPMSSLNPLHPIGAQVAETIRIHQNLPPDAAMAQALSWLERVRVRDAASRLKALPHQLSGGERQRVMIAMALANKPALLIADEPTTALDVTVQAQILDLLRHLKADLDLAILLISHDLKLVEGFADTVCVMQKGAIVETGPARSLFASPQHPYTQALVAAHPEPLAPRPPSPEPPVIAAQNLKVAVPVRAGLLRLKQGEKVLLSDVSLAIAPGRTLGVVGESGSGKTTLGLALLRLMESEGALTLDGQTIDGLRGQALRALRGKMQIVFQDPFASLSPRMTIGEIVGEGLTAHAPGLDAAARQTLVDSTLQRVNLGAEYRMRYPHELSGGQRQRVAIARAMILKPKFVVLDEPTSALDAQTQALILGLLKDLQERDGIAYLFISHDLGAVRAMADDIMVLKDGHVIEHGPAAQILEHPQTDYTRALMRAATTYSADGA